MIGGVLVLALALWKIRILIALLFLAFILAAAMRPGVEALHQRRIPRGIGITLHYLAFAGLMALLLWLVVPRATSQVRAAIGDLPTSSSELEEQTKSSTGFRREVLAGVQDRLENLPTGTELLDPALELTFLGVEIAVGIFFVLASAAYWIFERDRAVDLFASLIPRPRRKVMRDTWT